MVFRLVSNDPEVEPSDPITWVGVVVGACDGFPELLFSPPAPAGCTVPFPTLGVEYLDVKIKLLAAAPLMKKARPEVAQVIPTPAQADDSEAEPQALTALQSITSVIRGTEHLKTVFGFKVTAHEDFRCFICTNFVGKDIDLWRSSVQDFAAARIGEIRNPQLREELQEMKKSFSRFLESHTQVTDESMFRLGQGLLENILRLLSRIVDAKSDFNNLLSDGRGRKVLDYAKWFPRARQAEFSGGRGNRQPFRKKQRDFANSNVPPPNPAQRKN